MSISFAREYLDTEKMEYKVPKKELKKKRTKEEFSHFRSTEYQEMDYIKRKVFNEIHENKEFSELVDKYNEDVKYRTNKFIWYITEKASQMHHLLMEKYKGPWSSCRLYYKKMIEPDADKCECGLMINKTGIKTKGALATHKRGALHKIRMEMKEEKE